MCRTPHPSRVWPGYGTRNVTAAQSSALEPTAATHPASSQAPLVCRWDPLPITHRPSPNRPVDEILRVKLSDRKASKMKSESLLESELSGVCSKIFIRLDIVTFASASTAMLEKFPHRPRPSTLALAPSTLPLRPLSTGLDAPPNAHLGRNVSIEMAVALAAVLALRPERPGGAHSPSRFSNFPSRRLNYF